MAKVQNTFVKSKMNQDLDARLLPNGEYRSAKNAQISKSENSQVGNLENILGNSPVILNPTTGNTNVRSLTGIGGLICIGNFVDEFNSVVYLFFTDYTDTDTDVNNYETTANNFIISYDVSQERATILVKGSFLNFSTTNLILGVNLLENLLFFTDNRNQPRVIDTVLANTDSSNTNPTYYTTEDQISVAKFSPFKSMELYEKSVLAPTADVPYETTMKDVSSLFMPDGGSAICNGGVNPASVNIPIVQDSIVGQVNDGSIYAAADVSLLDPQLNVLIPTGAKVTTGVTSTLIVLDTAITVQNGQKLVFNPNPYYDNTFSGDPEYLESKFVRFSYRFKYTNNEYSLFAPFTQIAFIPKQDGYFMSTQSPDVPRDDQKEAYQSSIVYFVENKVNRIGLRIPLPFSNITIDNALKLDEIDILYKESDAVAVKLIETIPIKDVKESSAIAVVDGNQGPIFAGGDIDIKEIQGGIKVGEVISGSGFTLGTTVTSFVPTNSNDLTSGKIQVDKIVANLTDGVSIVVGDINFFTYDYNSTKPTRTLPESELVRVFDKVPIKALAQEVAGNRVMYGNFVNKIDPPAALDYNVISTPKAFFEINEVLTTTTQAGAVAGGGTIAITLTKGVGYTPPQGLVPGMVCSSPTFGVTIPDNTTIVSTTNQFQDLTVTALANPITASTTIVLVNTTSDLEIGSEMSGPGIPVGPAPIVQSYNPSSGAVVLDIAVTTVANTQYTFTTPFSSNADITLSNDVTFPSPSTTVILIFQAGGDVSNTTSYIEYPNSSVKTNRNYQVGFVLSDRYGRTSSVLLSNNKEAITIYNQTYSGSTLYSPYIDGNTPQTQWPGNSLKVIVNKPIDPTIIYNGDSTSADYNPLGWYSYKVVVKQTEQDYYNVYLPGIMNSYPTDFKKEVGQTAHVVLINDNINKIPRNLEEVGPDQKQFGSSIQLFGRVQNTLTEISGFNDLGQANTQYYLQKQSDTVSVISTVQDLFDYNPVEPPRPNYFPQLYSLDSNPLVARITTQRPIGQLSTTNFSADSGKSLKPINQQDLNPTSGTPTPTFQAFPTPEPQKTLQVVAYTSTSGGSLAAPTIANDDLVSGPGIPDEVYVKTGTQITFKADLTPTSPGDVPVGIQVNLYRLNSSGTEVDFYFTPVENEVYTFQPTTNRVLENPGIQYLAVYETAPTESLLDIYYETSSSGLISDLNQAVVNNQDVEGALDLFPFTSTLFTEGLGRKANILNNPNSLANGFGIVNSIGSPVTLNPANGDSISLTLVTNELGQQCGGVGGNTVLEQEGVYFLLEDSTGAQGGQVGPWQIRTTDDTDSFFGSFTNTANYYDNIFYGYNQGKRVFNFTFQITFNGTLTSITKTLELGNESPLFTKIEAWNSPAQGNTNPQIYGPGTGNIIPSPPDSIPIKTTRIAGLNVQVAVIEAQNGANNEDLAREDLVFEGGGQEWQPTSGNTSFRIFEQKRGGIGPSFPDAISVGFPIFKIVPNFLPSTPNTKSAILQVNDPQYGSAAAGQAAFGATIPADVYYVTVRAQDADTFEDVIFKVDMRIVLTGGENGNIRNMAFRSKAKQGAFSFGPFANTGYKAMLPTASSNENSTPAGNSNRSSLQNLNPNIIDCGFRFYGSVDNFSLFPSTLFNIPPGTSGATTNIDTGWYLYAGGYFSQYQYGFNGDPSPEGRVQPSVDLLNDYSGNPQPSGDFVVTIPRNLPDANGFKVQTQAHFENQDALIPLTVATGVVKNISYGSLTSYPYIDVENSSLNFSFRNPLLNEITVGMRVYKNFPNVDDILTSSIPFARQTKNRIIKIEQINLPFSNPKTRFTFSAYFNSNNENITVFESGIQVGDVIRFYGGKLKDPQPNPWFFVPYNSNAEKELALKKIMVLYMTSQWGAGAYNCPTGDTVGSGIPSTYYSTNNFVVGFDGGTQPGYGTGYINVPGFPTLDDINNVDFNLT